MPITTDPYTTADFPVSIPELYLDMVLEEMFPKSVASGFFLNLSTEFENGGKIANISDLYTNSFSVNSQSTPMTEVTTESVAEVKKTISLGSPKYIATAVGDEDFRRLRSNFDFVERMAHKMGGALRRQFEQDVFALHASVTQEVGTGGSALSDLDIRNAIKAVEEQNYDLSEMAFFFHPDTYYRQIAGIQKVYDAAMRGSTQSLVASGAVDRGSVSDALRGVLYGVRFYVTTNIAEGTESTVTYKYNLLAAPEAFAFAFANLDRPSIGAAVRDNVRVIFSYQHRNLGSLLTVDSQWGVAAVRPEAAVKLKADVSQEVA